MTPQQLIAALDAFEHAVRAQSAISKFPEGGMSNATPFNRWKTPPHHNARPPRKVRKHERRKRNNYPMFFRRMLRNLLHDTLIHPEPDGA